jgi:hypothetical protein
MTTKLEVTEPSAETYSVRDAAAAAGYRSTAQFVRVWQSKGLGILQPSPRKRSVFVADLHQFIKDHLTKKETSSCLQKTSTT